MTAPFHTVAADWLRQCVVEVRQGRSAGSGFTWAFDMVVTNAHVARDGPLEVRLPDGEVLPARVRFADQARDIAVLDVPRLGLPAVIRRDPTELRPGHALFAIGHPLGVPHAMSSGILHTVGPLPDGFPVPPRLQRLPWVQADLPLAPGNSGGPLADAEGRVVGVCTMIVSGLALAVPITAVEAALRARAA
jgi:serine protease Do